MVGRFIHKEQCNRRGGVAPSVGLVVGGWLLVAGCWLLVAGCWLLVVDCW
jgi:hypothetical protein